MLEQVVTRHCPEIALRTDNPQSVWMFAPHNRLDFLAQPELRIVLTALALADDHRTLRLGLVRLDARVVQAVGLDCQRQVEFGRGQRLEVSGAVDPGERVQRPAAARDFPRDLPFAKALAAL